MRQPPVRRDENGRLVAVPVSEHPQDPDVDAIFEELVAQVFGNGPVLALLTQGVVFAGRRYEPALGGNRGDPSQDRLGVALQGHQHELAMHGGRLEIVLVRQDEIRVELEPALGEAEKSTNHLGFLEERH
jgi:hypothetical protein